MMENVLYLDCAGDYMTITFVKTYNFKKMTFTFCKKSDWKRVISGSSKKKKNELTALRLMSATC